jgi:hypothetical protein
MKNTRIMITTMIMSTITAWDKRRAGSRTC